jgi:RNA polymerase sigma-70 factor, ECF subfamily
MGRRCSTASRMRSALDSLAPLAEAVLFSRPMGPESDAELLRRIQAQDRAAEAEAEVCRRFAPRIRLYGLRHLRSEERAQDLVQAVLIAVLLAMRSDRIEQPERIDRFVLGTCRNIALRMRDTDARLIPVDDRALDVATQVSTDDHLDVAALIHCLSRLDDRARLVVYLSFHEERAPTEIAAQLETTLGNIRVLRHRAMKDLRQCLGVTS